MANEVTAGLTYTVFAAYRRIATGSRQEVVLATKRHLDEGGEPVLIFEDQTGRQIDFDFSGEIADILARANGSPKPGPGRPKLGVVSREVSLLPRQWEWLEAQPNGISAAIRRLVDEARHNETGSQRGRHVRDAVGRFMWALAGNLPHFEEASRALYARDDAQLAKLVSDWPGDLREHLLRLVSEAAQLEAW